MIKTKWKLASKAAVQNEEEKRSKDNPERPKHGGKRKQSAATAFASVVAKSSFAAKMQWGNWGSTRTPSAKERLSRELDSRTEQRRQTEFAQHCWLCRQEVQSSRQVTPIHSLHDLFDLFDNMDGESSSGSNKDSSSSSPSEGSDAMLRLMQDIGEDEYGTYQTLPPSKPETPLSKIATPVLDKKGGDRKRKSPTKVVTFVPD
ncbi:PREDICTED: uncharacterized protein LOC109487818 [Branchiostoma belcheri]|uniref:Uncharacterized protein LOC109487818 n=1 Tax=Branchiostoma belcheri TaxID=7741 RepID=A0A6P5AZ79_BRABE|nr:PREDICTED: uncharacterized protein LOC109487818 [Branchiostoma belcheri]